MRLNASLWSKWPVYLPLAALLIMAMAGHLWAAPTTQAPAPAISFVERVIVLTNEARAQEGLPPLKANPELAVAAQVQTDAMAAHDFFDHTDPNTGTTVGERAQAAGYSWVAIGENLAAGATTPADVVAGWLKSPGHRANILNPDFREIGVGYTLDGDDVFPASPPYVHYWAQVFGAQRAVFPLVIANEAPTIDAPAAPLYLYGTEWAQEMRLHNDDAPFGDWQPFQSTLDWQLPTAGGVHTVTVELRNGAQVVTAADSIYLNATGAVAAVVATATLTVAPTLPLTPTNTLAPTVVVPPLVAPATPAPGAPSGGTLLAPSQTITLTLCPGAPRTLPLVVPIPARPARADVLLAFDVSSSMDKVLAAAAANGVQIADTLRALIPDVQIGVASFDDYPLPGYGKAGDTPYQLRQAITSDNNALTNVLNELPGLLQDGGDPPEAYTRLLYEAGEDSAIGWRPGARHFLIVFGDNVGRAKDPGRDGLENTADDLTLDQALEELGDKAIVPLFASSNPDAVKTWLPLIKNAGGEVVLLDNAGRLASVINDLVVDSSAHIGQLAIAATPGYGNWLVDNGAVRDLTVGNGLEQTLNATVIVPANTFDGDYTMTLSAVGDGAVYATWVVHFTVTCGLLPPIMARITNWLTCDSWLWLWVLPLLVPLLIFLLWLLLQLWSQRRQRQDLPGTEKPPWWRCGLPCLLALLWLLFIGYLFGQRLAQFVCVAWDTRTAQAAVANANTGTSVLTPGAVGAKGSEHVGAFIPAGLFVLASERPEVVIEQISLDNLDATLLARYDTLILSQVCNIADQPAARLNDLVTWVGNGHKLILYDSDECSGSVDYRWLPYPFTTNNPGALGSTTGQLTVVADDTLVATSATHPGYIDPTGFAGIEIGDANVIVTQDYRWCGNIEAVNANGVQGYVHGYTRYGKGLIIYNGLDTDNQNAPGPYQLWQHELNQPWDAVNGAPVGLPCQRRVAGSIDLWAPIIFLGIPLPWWFWLLPALLLAVLCWLGCRRWRTVERPIEFPEPPSTRPYQPPPEPFGRWAGLPPVWDPEKTLIIGLGGTGRWALTLIKKNLLDAGAGKLSPHVRLLLIDTTPDEEIGQERTEVSFAGVRLSREEILAVGDDLGPLIRDLREHADRLPELATWLPTDYYANRKESELDLRRSTGGERPLGRAIAFSDLHRADASQIWAALVEGVRAAQEGEQARVMVVGSLAGGFGGAVLADIAYLVRHAARKVGARFASVEAYLACQRTFDAVVNFAGQRGLASNTFAALQELRRFQLQGVSFPYRIRYTSLYPGDPVWDGQMDRPLLDDLYLFDGYRPDRPLLREKPVNGVLATLADMVTLHLDRNSRAGAGSIWAYRRQMQGMATDVARQTGHAVAGSAGIFAYRLPVYDITQALAVRWAKHLLGYFVVGEAGGPLRLAAELKRERLPMADSPRALATNFVQGTAELGDPPRSMAVVGSVAQYPPKQWAHWVTASALSGLDTEERLYQQYLVQALQGVLNGYATDLLTARTGKLRFALDWLDQVDAAWQAVDGQLTLVAAQLGSATPANFDSWRQLPARYRTVTQAVRKQVVELCPIISSELDLNQQQASWRTVGRQPRAVFDLLLALEDILTRQRSELAAVVTRRYFMGDALLNRWYEQYLAQQVVEHVGRLYWAPLADGSGVDLVFNGLGGPTHLFGDGAEAMTQALMAVAGYLAADVWSQETLASYLNEADLRPERTATTANEMWATSTPLLDFDPGRAPDVQALAVLGVNQTVRDTRALEGSLAKKLPSERQLRRLDLSDPYTMLLARFIDAIPADATTPFREAEQAYRGAVGLSVDTAGQMTGAAPRVIFPAERTALRYQQRLWELNQTPRLFHPLFVAALEDEGRAVLFVQALAAGLVHWAYQEGRDVRVVEGTEGAHPLTQAGDIGFYRVSPTIGAMLNFVAAPERVLRSVETRLERMADRRQRWYSWVQNDLPQLHRSPEEGDRDLAAFADLVLYDLLKRENNQEEKR